MHTLMRYQFSHSLNSAIILFKQNDESPEATLKSRLSREFAPRNPEFKQQADNIKKKILWIIRSARSSHDRVLYVLGVLFLKVWNCSASERQLKVRGKYRSLLQLQFLNCFCGPAEPFFSAWPRTFPKEKGYSIMKSRIGIAGSRYNFRLKFLDET
ncbi:hypothetical protein NA56DRAFT_388662 [Hyaloscypha hepaticicola]|uniref:Uncharacterized protein n=1 Tax=Hyaloscypha hepaticicola TaxID=2082293 RepID=A0A2J6QI04_9HELO|nr:hypothetical protein NA56DRAFT_388662 [Hyaloscypha hepaticicola]